MEITNKDIAIHIMEYKRFEEDGYENVACPSGEIVYIKNMETQNVMINRLHDYLLFRDEIQRVIEKMVDLGWEFSLLYGVEKKYIVSFEKVISINYRGPQSISLRAEDENYCRAIATAAMEAKELHDKQKNKSL